MFNDIDNEYYDVTPIRNSPINGEHAESTVSGLTPFDVDKYFGFDTTAMREDARYSGMHTHQDAGMPEGVTATQYVLVVAGMTSHVLQLTRPQLTRYEVNTYIDGERAITRRRRSAKEVAQVFMHNVDAILEDARESGKHTYNERAFGRLFSHVITISE
jgi:hypothetical protein